MSGGSVETRVSEFLARYRITPQTSTGVSPAELLLGRKPRSRLDLAYPEIGSEGKCDKAKLLRNRHMTGTLRNAPCKKGKPFTQATSEQDQGGYLES